MVDKKLIISYLKMINKIRSVRVLLGSRDILKFHK